MRYAGQGLGRVEEECSRTLLRPRQHRLNLRGEKVYP